MAEPLTLNEVQRVANLARLKLTPDELQAMSSQLSRILDYVTILNEIDTSDIAPLSHAVETSNVFRDDVVRESLQRAEALANAPKTDGKCFLVPQVIEH